VIPYHLEADLQGFWNKYQKPIIVSEYGADTVPGLHHDPAFMVQCDGDT
jgi:beta-glucuronidase